MRGHWWHVETGYAHSGDTTVGDVIAYERNEYGNTITLAPDVTAQDLARPARLAVWCYPTRQQARDWARDHSESYRNISAIDGRPVAYDPDGGALVLEIWRAS